MTTFPNVNALVRRYLVSQAAITSQVSTRVYWPRLPKDFTIAKAISFAAAAGMGNVYGPISRPAIQFYCWGSSANNARTVYLALKGVLFDAQHVSVANVGCILSSIEQTEGQDVIDPDDPTWHSVLSSWEITARLTG